MHFAAFTKNKINEISNDIIKIQTFKEALIINFCTSLIAELVNTLTPIVLVHLLLFW